MKKECGNCIWADVSDKPRTIVKDNVTMHQSPGSIMCTCSSIKEIRITDRKMLCSSYKSKGKTANCHS